MTVATSGRLGKLEPGLNSVRLPSPFALRFRRQAQDFDTSARTGFVCVVRNANRIDAPNFRAQVSPEFAIQWAATCPVHRLKA
jgi:hypothetical protein